VSSTSTVHSNSVVGRDRHSPNHRQDSILPLVNSGAVTVACASLARKKNKDHTCSTRVFVPGNKYANRRAHRPRKEARQACRHVVCWPGNRFAAHICVAFRPSVRRSKAPLVRVATGATTTLRQWPTFRPGTKKAVPGLYPRSAGSPSETASGPHSLCILHTNLSRIHHTYAHRHTRRLVVVASRSLREGPLVGLAACPRQRVPAALWVKAHRP